MKKDMAVVRNGLVVNAGSFEKSHIEGWVDIYSKAGENIGGFNFLEHNLVVIHNHKIGDDIYLTYSLRDRGAK